VVGRIVNASGAPQGSPAVVTTTTDAQYTPSVAFNGTNYVVGYTEWNGTNEDALARFVATNGTPTGTPFTLANGAGDQTAPFVAKSGTSVLAVWSQAGDIHARSLGSDGTLGTAFPISTATDAQELPSVTQGTGTNLYVVYADKQTGTYAVTGTRATLTEIVAPTIVVPAGPLLCDKVTLEAKPASPQAVGTKIELTADATCAAGATPEYEFAVDSGSGFKVIRPYGAAATFSWDTSSAVAGSHQVRVNARRSGSAVPQEASETIAYTLTGGTADAGSPGGDAGAGIDGGSTPAPGSSSGCSCSTLGESSSSPAGSLALVGAVAGVLIALGRRRR
jgi:MYXO-CTERM domain-containing protein